jgi:hypothetical protein
MTYKLDFANAAPRANDRSRSIAGWLSAARTALPELRAGQDNQSVHANSGMFGLLVSRQVGSSRLF